MMFNNSVVLWATVIGAIFGVLIFLEKRKINREVEVARRKLAQMPEYTFGPKADMTAQELALIALKGKGIHKSYRIPVGSTLDSQIGAAARHFQPKEATNDAS